MPGKPAARLGDTAMTCGDPVDAPTGAVVAAGTVFINGLPAAKQNDQVIGVDTHIILVPAGPTTVPTPIPHPFNGIINGGCEPTVMIMGMPAAVVGSTAQNTPPHIPQGGAFAKPPTNMGTIILGSPNVFIGCGSGGGGGGGSGSVDGAIDPAASASVDASSTSIGEQAGHYIDIYFVDKAERPVLGAFYELTDPDGKEHRGKLSGRIKRYGVSPGNCDVALKVITKAAWSVKGELKTGEAVRLEVETKGIEDGAAARFVVWERDIDREDELVASLNGEVSGDKAAVSWVYDGKRTDGFDPNSYSLPDYYFTVDIDGMKKKSGILVYTMDIDIEVREKDEKPLKGSRYKLNSATGEIREGTLDGSGKASEKDLPPRDVLFGLVENDEDEE